MKLNPLNLTKALAASTLANTVATTALETFSNSERPPSRTSMSGTPSVTARPPMTNMTTIDCGCNFPPRPFVSYENITSTSSSLIHPAIRSKIATLINDTPIATETITDCYPTPSPGRNLCETEGWNVYPCGNRPNNTVTTVPPKVYITCSSTFLPVPSSVNSQPTANAAGRNPANPVFKVAANLMGIGR